MPLTINRLLTLYATMALITTTRQSYANPILSIDTNPQATPNSENTHPIRAIHYQFDQKMDPYLQLFKFNSSSPSSSTSDHYESSYTTTGTSSSNTYNEHTLNSATCNDGSPAGYYKRLNNHSKSWIIYLQGGGFCGSEEACQHRWSRSTHLMTSNFWQKSLSVDGILSSEPKDNPYLWNANHIYVPYCSSDSWTGSQEAARTADGSSQSSFAFMGSKIIEKVVESLFDDLPRDSSLHEAKFILLAGDSAGATGVMMNLDKVNRLVQERFASQAARSCVPTTDGRAQLCEPRQVPIVRGLADSGWFLDNEPYDSYQQEQPVVDSTSSSSSLSSSSSSSQSDSQPGLNNEPVDCLRQRCSPLQSIKQAMTLWNGQVPAACAVRHASEPWRCYFGYRAYPSLRTPLFVVQWLYDEAQLMVDNIIRPGTNSQWNYVNKLVSELRASLENVTALFAPSCLSHSLIVKQSWNRININGFKLPHILNSWEEETLASQPTLELLTQDEQDLQRHIQQQFFSATLGVLGVSQPATISSGNLMALIGRDQLFDRLVAPQHQRELAPPTSYKQQYEMRRSLPGTASATASSPQSTTTNHARTRSRKKKRNNQQQQSASRTNAVNSNRLSRSTMAFEESTVVFNNNVPDVLTLSNSKQQEQASEKFRLIDNCGWPQCNRDCPNMDLDLSFRPVSPY